jgi:hypothetical protein
VIAAVVLLTGIGAAAATQEDDKEERDRERSEDSGGRDALTEESFGDVTVEVLELERTSGRTVTLRFALTNDGDEEYELWDHFGEFVNDWSMGGVYLFDDANSIKYLSLREGDTAEGCVCTVLETSIEEIEPGDRREFFVKFPAPPKATDTVSIVLPPLGTVDAVEIAE